MRFEDEAPNLGVITTKNVLEGAPVLMVSHDEEDGGWQFLCGTTNEPSDGRIIHLTEILNRDPTLLEVSDLPLGWVAFRSAVNGEWKREPR